MTIMDDEDEDPTTQTQYGAPVCELVYKPEARVEKRAGRSIRIVCKVARPVDSNFEVKFYLN